MKIKHILIALSLFFGIDYAPGQSFRLPSPDKNIEITVTVKEQIQWNVSYKGRMIIEAVDIAMDLGDGLILGKDPVMTDSTFSLVKEEIRPVVPNKDKIITDEYSQLRLDFKGDYAVNFRVYNDGVAYQFSSNMQKEIEVFSEDMSIHFPENTATWFPLEVTMYSHYEPLYIPGRVDQLKEGQFCSLPVLFRSNEKVNILFSEAALHDYPAMFLEAAPDNSLQAVFPKYVLEAKPAIDNGPDRNEIITKEAGFIARTNGNREFPWRVFIISDDDRVLVESNLIYQLSRPVAIENTDWIRPGKVAWDWYNANNIFGVDFKSGLNTATYKYYIDFASENSIEYVILDEGWTKSTTEIMESNPDLDVHELIAYGKSKDVGIILWVLWKPLNENMEAILDAYAGWGARGIKVDFMQRADQYMVNSYTAIARECAGRELLVDYHGAFKPAGLRREYPNVLSYEGVKGNENNKWSRDITPEHTLTLPFIRMVAGPMDFTPGSMRNMGENNFYISFEQPASMGTRCHQVAMYIVYESPLQMLCENPSVYRKEQETVDFISRIPVTWDETIVLKAAVSDYIVIARCKDTSWYIGAMTDGTAREFEIDLSFLPEGNHSIEIMQDGINADRWAEDYKKTSGTVTRDKKLTLKMVSGGGWAAIISESR